MSSLPFFLLPVPAVTFLLPVVLAEWVAQRLTVCCSLAFCSLLELVVTSLKTGPGWWSGADGWRKLWGRSFSSKPMRWSWISKNWATFRLIHSWKSTWHLCWWRCWNELTYIIIFPALIIIIIFLLLWSPALHLTGKKKPLHFLRSLARCPPQLHLAFPASLGGGSWGSFKTWNIRFVWTGEALWVP